MSAGFYKTCFVEKTIVSFENPSKIRQGDKKNYFFVVSKFMSDCQSYDSSNTQCFPIF